MKKLFLILVLLALTLTQVAQLRHGRFMIGGSFAFNNNYTRNSDTVNPYKELGRHRYSLVSVRLGYFVSDNVVMGVYYTNSKTIRDQRYDYKDGRYNSISYYNLNNVAGIFGRRFFKISTSRFALFGQLNAGIGTGTIRQDDNYTEAGFAKTRRYRGSFNNYMLNFQPGLTYFLNDRIGIETTFGNLSLTTSNEKMFDENNVLISERVSTTLTPHFGFDFRYIQFGLNFYFGKGRKIETPASESGQK